MQTHPKHLYAKLSVPSKSEAVFEATRLSLLTSRNNGCGFDAQRVHPKGLGSLRERAAAIGARLDVSNAPGRTVVEIGLA